MKLFTELFVGVKETCAAFLDQTRSLFRREQSFHFGPPTKRFRGVAGLFLGRGGPKAAQHQVPRHRPASCISPEEIGGIVERSNGDGRRSSQLQRRCEQKRHATAQSWPQGEVGRQPPLGHRTLSACNHLRIVAPDLVTQSAEAIGSGSNAVRNLGTNAVSIETPAAFELARSRPQGVILVTCAGFFCKCRLIYCILLAPFLIYFVAVLVFTCADPKYYSGGTSHMWIGLSAIVRTAALCFCVASFARQPRLLRPL